MTNIVHFVYKVYYYRDRDNYVMGIVTETPIANGEIIKRKSRRYRVKEIEHDTDENTTKVYVVDM